MNLSNKNVLVTGGAGFIGSALVRELLNENANVTVYDNFSSGDMTNLSGLEDSIKIVKGDVLDDKLKNVLLENEVDYVFNLAAEPYIPDCYNRPKKIVEVNAVGTLNVLVACMEAKVRKVLHYSTSEVYGSAEYIPMDEKHPTKPLSTYAVSKLAADRLCYTLHHEHGIPVIVLRQFNTYGPRETQPYVIPEIITQLSRTNKLKLGNIKAKRDLTYVEDAVKGAVALMECDKAEGEVVNLGSGKSYSIEEMANIAAELMGYNSVEIFVEPQRLRPLDVELLQCDFSKARKLIGWKPKVDLEEGLRRTIEWFKENGGRWIWEIRIAPEEEMWKRGSKL